VNRIVPYTIPADVAKALPQVSGHLRDGGLIAYPTETVYGFGGLVREDAVQRLAELKSREPGKPFLLLILDEGQAAWLQWTSSARMLAKHFWPGALTIVLQVPKSRGEVYMTNDSTLAVRATPHEGIRALLQHLGEPITSTSANGPGQAPANDAKELVEVLESLAADDVLILDGGRLAPSLPSTIVDCSHEPPRIIREGAIQKAALAKIVELA